MQIKEAAQRAKQHIAELFTDEGARHIGLEEIEYDDAAGAWHVTVGFTRPWDQLNEPTFASVSEMLKTGQKRVRDMKVVTLSDSDGSLVSVKNRE
jgi:hypothetical protein